MSFNTSKLTFYLNNIELVLHFYRKLLYPSVFQVNIYDLIIIFITNYPPYLCQHQRKL